MTYVTLEIGCLGYYTKDVIKSFQLLQPSQVRKTSHHSQRQQSSWSKSIFPSKKSPNLELLHSTVQPLICLVCSVPLPPPNITWTRSLRTPYLVREASP